MQITKRTILVGFIIFIVLAGIGGFWFYRNNISKEVLKLEILGSESTKVGDEVEYTVKYKNNGNFVLEKPKLIFELPENSLTEDSKIRFEQELDDVYPGNEAFLKFRGRLLGKEGDLKSTKASLSYIPRKLSVRYEANTTFTTKIESVPITLTYDLPTKIEKGKEINYSINYFSNVDYPLENLSIKVDPVDGFDLKSTNPLSLDNSEWKLNTLTKGKGGRISIKGDVTSDAGGKLNFSMRMGMWQAGSFVVIKETAQEVEVIQPLLYISQEINGSANYIASAGETLNYKIFLRNIGSTAFDNLFVISRLEGAALDLATLKSSRGQVNANDNLIVFDSRQISVLEHLAPQQEVHVDFSVKLKDTFDVANQNNTVIKNKINAFDVSAEFETKISSKIEISQKGYHATFDGIESEGPIPPEVSKTTTYTINWKIRNTLNDVKNVKVKAFLPDNVTISDAIFPESQASNFSLDSASREIVWLAGNLASGAEASMSFQVALTPSVSQRGLVVKLINQATVFAEDQFTGSVSQSVSQSVTTSLFDDQANAGGGIVK